jgi:hypothetical protein
MSSLALMKVIGEGIDDVEQGLGPVIGAIDGVWRGDI